VIVRSWIDGWLRVRSSPATLLGVVAMTFVLALPLAVTFGDQVRAQLGRSAEADAAAAGINWDWWQEFTSQATGLGTTFVPQIAGFAGSVRNISNVIDRVAEIVPIFGAIAIYLVGWTLLSGGVIDRYARQRPTRAHGFFAACGVFFFRFLRLAIAAGLVYSFLFAVVHPWLFGKWFTAAIADVDEERIAFAWRLLMYATFGLLLAAANVVFDYAKVRMVIEDRRSAIGAISAAIRFMARNRGRVTGLYFANALTFVLLLAVWAAVAPDGSGTGASMWIGVAIAQAYITARLALKLHFLASQTALFQRSLAHASHIAVPAPAWPESPAAEMIRPERIACPTD
jgi:hypothetical protein